MYWISSIFSSQRAFRKPPLLSTALPELRVMLAELCLLGARGNRGHSAFRERTGTNFLFWPDVIRACITSTLTQLSKTYEPHTGLKMATNNQNLIQLANAVGNSLIPNGNKNLVDLHGSLVKACGFKICALAYLNVMSQSSHQWGVLSSKIKALSCRGMNEQATCVLMCLDFAKHCNTKTYHQYLLSSS